MSIKIQSKIPRSKSKSNFQLVGPTPINVGPDPTLLTITCFKISVGKTTLLVSANFRPLLWRCPKKHLACFDFSKYARQTSLPKGQGKYLHSRNLPTTTRSITLCSLTSAQLGLQYFYRNLLCVKVLSSPPRQRGLLPPSGRGLLN